MKEITGAISLLGGVGWGLFFLHIIVDEGIRSGEDLILLLILLLSLICCVSIVLYVVWTKFGKKELSELEKNKV